MKSKLLGLLLLCSTFVIAQPYKAFVWKDSTAAGIHHAVPMIPGSELVINGTITDITKLSLSDSSTVFLPYWFGGKYMQLSDSTTKYLPYWWGGKYVQKSDSTGDNDYVKQWKLGEYSIKAGSSSITTVGALTSGSIATGFTSIDTAFTNAISKIVAQNTFLIVSMANKAAFLRIDTSKYATASMTGFLSFTDWVRFNAMATGAVTSVTASSGLQSSGGTTPAITPATGYTIPTLASIVRFGKDTVGFVNVTEFGTDSAGFKNALDHLIASSTKRKFYIPAGTYTLGNIDFPDSIEVYGDGMGITTLIHNDYQGNFITWNKDNGGSADPNSNLKNIYIHDLSIYGRSDRWASTAQDTTDRQDKSLIKLTAVTNVLIERVELRAFRCDGIYIGNQNSVLERHNFDVTIRDCYFNGSHLNGDTLYHDNRNGVSVIDGTNITVENCVFENIGHYPQPGAIDFEPNSTTFGQIINGKILRNRFRRIHNASVIVYAPRDNMVQTVPSYGMLIEGNNIDSCWATAPNTGINIAPLACTVGYTEPNNVKIINNSVKHTKYPLYIYRGNGIEVAGNYFAQTSDGVQYAISSDTVWNLSSHHNTYWRVDTATNGRGVTVGNVRNFRLNNETFIDCGKTTGSGVAIRLGSSSTSDNMRINDNTAISPAGRMTYFISKSGSHTTTNTTTFNNSYGTLTNDLTDYIQDSVAQHRTEINSNTTLVNIKKKEGQHWQQGNYQQPTVSNYYTNNIGDATCQKINITTTSTVRYYGLIFDKTFTTDSIAWRCTIADTGAVRWHIARDSTYINPLANHYPVTIVTQSARDTASADIHWTSLVGSEVTFNAGEVYWIGVESVNSSAVSGTTMAIEVACISYNSIPNVLGSYIGAYTSQPCYRGFTSSLTYATDIVIPTTLLKMNNSGAPIMLWFRFKQ